MNTKKLILLALITSVLFSFSTNLFGDSSSTTPKPYSDEEFPQILQDFRRFEIITLGSMPFIMLDSSIAYSGYKYIKGDSKDFNFLGSNSYTYEETKNLIITSLSISAAIGLTDYIVRLVKRNNAKKKDYQRNNTNSINIRTVPKTELTDNDMDLFEFQTSSKTSDTINSEDKQTKNTVIVDDFFEDDEFEVIE